mgnify:CR=1 FL=1
MLLKNAQVVGGVHVEKLPFIGNLDGSHTFLVGLSHHAAALARGIQFVPSCQMARAQCPA